MVKNFGKRLLPLMLAVILILSAMPLQVLVSAAEVSVLDDQVTVVDDKGRITVSGGEVTVKAEGGLFGAETNNIYIYNESGKTAKLTFSYTASNYNKFTIDGTSAANASGTYEALLDAGASATMSISGKTALMSGQAQLVLSDFSLVVAADASEIELIYDEALGSITADGNEVKNGTVLNVTSSDGVSLTATVSDSAEFLGWINPVDGRLLSSDSSFELYPAEAMQVKAVFIGENSVPHFMLGSATENSAYSDWYDLTRYTYYTVSNGTHLFDNLDDAATASANSTSKVIVLMNSSTLPTGDYTIPAGSTLLIPFDDTNTMYTTQAVSTETYTTPTAYRTLTLASGVNLTVNGAVSLSAMHHYAQGKSPTLGGGTPVGKVSFVKMEENSNITVDNGGALYAYGFITGNGTVTAKNGGTVYENFQIMDFRGGTQSTTMDNGVFPMSQYYVQNIEVPLTLEYGAREYSYTTIYMSSNDYGSSVNFIGPDSSMFNLTSGSVTKMYDGSTDRLNIELNGNMTVSPIDMSIGGTSLNSEKYELPVNSNITVDVKSGSNIAIGQDMALLPGSEIILENGANCTLNSGINIYVYDADQWGNFVFTGSSDTTFTPVIYAPGRTYNRTSADLVDAKIRVDGTIDASQGYAYTTAGGANIFTTGTGVAITGAGSETTTYQCVQTPSVTYTEIPLTPAKLKNADGSYLQSVTDTYTYADGKWKCTNHSYNSVKTEPTCTEQGYTTHTCVACGDSYVDDYVKATGHSGEWQVDVEAKHDITGKESRVCSVCGESEVRDIPQIICDYDGEDDDGNVKDDGEVNGVELTWMRKYLLGLETPTEKAKILFDMNDDGKISLKDLVKLKRYIAGI